MKVDIDFEDKKLNKIIELINENYTRFNMCEISVTTDEVADIETGQDDYDIDYQPEVTIKLKFSY